MIPETGAMRQTPAWQRELAAAITDPAQLLEAVGLDAGWLPAARAAARLFPLRVPRGFVARMQRGNPHDPLLRQVLPLVAECESAPDFTTDPVGDLAAMKAPGVLHKYRGRVLLALTGACAVHCRYCFRRHFPYAEANAASDRWRGALEYIAREASIREVILSGGDPLAMTDRRLADLARQLATVAHVERLRIHSRLPIVLPSRVTAELTDWFAGGRLQPVMVVHVNHANEIDANVRTALAQLRAAGVTLFNQSVLLKGVNDSVESLTALCEALFATGVVPYYLHLLDRVKGAMHFEVEEGRARQLMAGLAARLPGYLVPRLVREVAGQPSKQWLTTLAP